MKILRGEKRRLVFPPFDMHKAKRKKKVSKKTLDSMWHILNIQDSISSFILRKRRVI